MAASNMWALIVGGLAAGGALTGAIVWQQNHPDQSPANAITKLTEPPSLNPPKATETPKAPATNAPPGQTDSAALVKGTPPKPEPTSGHGEPPHFDVVRVEPNGDAVVAGKGDPNAKVALMSEGKVVAETKADANGQFVLMPPALPPGGHDLSLRQSSDGKPTTDSKQNVAVSVPTKPNGDVLVALAEPGKPTKVLSTPPEQKTKAKPAPGVANAPPSPAQVATAKPETAVAPPTTVKPAGPDLAIRAVELENGSGLFASGVAAAGTRIQVYLNDAHLAQVVAGRDNQWSVTVKRGLSSGHYIVRADASGEGRKVTARVEVPFDVPVAMAAKPAEPIVAAPSAEPSDLGRPNEPPTDVANQIPHDAPPPRPSKPAEVASQPDRVPPAKTARSETLPDRGGPATTPPAAPSPAPAPRLDVAEAAKAKSAAAPSAAPPVLAVAPPTAAEKRPTPSPADTPVAAPRPATAPPTIAAARPTVAPPKAATVATSASPAAPETPDSANAVIEQLETATVVRGDNLWNISRARLGDGLRYTRIYTANSDQIRDPNLIYPGQVFVVPPHEAAN